MRIHLLAVGRRMPGWVEAGFEDYARRLSGAVRLELVEIPSSRRGTSDLRRAIDEEGARLLAALPGAARAIALDERGEPWSTRELSARMARWMQEGSPVALLIGGADGLSEACLARCESRWSLSALTLPHALVRVIVAEQLYRAASLLANHPYHRD